ncbi:penicillin-binding protein [Anoxybacillus gonensis]|uniref:penicillin-binding protein n=1 Tax=Anoxybacillus gonensis TaxID=198467 RepID=UPI0002BE9454|nr:penicillin-binding protein [Anoxybacillus gonensis]EMI11748.1 cell division protein FtsI/penicillin-binding protein 2 [Anoxybacillus gonensis]
MRKHKHTHRGAAIWFIFFSLLFFTLFGRFVYLQATGEVDGRVLANEAKNRYLKMQALEAKRGTIFDRHGEVIAEDIPSYTVAAVLDPNMPQHVTDPEETARKLAPLLKMDVADVERILKKKAHQVEFGPNGRGISQTLKRKIEALQLPGITFIRDSKRFYPNGTFASYVVGYAQKDEEKEEVVGKMGIEKQFNEQLKEKDGEVYYKGDQQGFKLPHSDETIVPPKNGKDVYLTIDKKIQTFLEDAMNAVEKQYAPKKMIAIVADAKTGAILAMSTRPSFNPNKRNIENYLNDAIAYPYEPGSTMKIFTLAAAVNEGVFQANETYQSGSYQVGSHRIRDHNKVGWGKITFLEGVQRSSNVAFAKIVREKLGEDRFLQYLHRFHFNEPTGIELPGEKVGNILYRYPIEKVTTGFGQGTSVTPIQQIQAATAIANGGKMMKPYVVDRIVDPDSGKTVVKHEPTVVDTPISKETAEKVLDILETVVTSENGTGRPYQIEGYRVAGKTGTAQIPDPKGGYLTGHQNYIFSFLGMAPRENPRLIMYVAVQQPNISYTETGAAPVSMIFNPVMKNSLQYLNIQPTVQKKREKKDKSIALPSYVGQSVEQAAQSLKKQGFNVTIIGKGTEVRAQFPKAGEHVVAPDRILLQTDGHAMMPDVTGWSLRDVMKLADLLQLKPSFIGSGYVFRQNIAPGAVVKQHDYIIVELAKPSHIDEKQQEDSEQQVDGPVD